jgi:hypothetical protein
VLAPDGARQPQVPKKRSQPVRAARAARATGRS